MIYAVNKQTKEHLICGMSIKRPDSQWDFVEADADGWIEWSGGECPFPKDQPYEVGFIKDNHTISYRPILDDKPQAPEWDGISWPPPVNSLVESFAANGDGIKCEVLAVRGDKVIACTTDTHMAGWITEEDTRPIRTPEQKAEDAMMKDLPSAMQSDPIRMVCRELCRLGYQKP